MSTDITYVLLVRDAAGKRLATMGTQREPHTLHGKITPAFHTVCTSLLDLVTEGVCIEVVKWEKGVEVDHVPVMLTVSRTEHTGSLAYHQGEHEE